MTRNLVEEYTWRGMVYDKTEGLVEAVKGKDPITAYIGFDPTAASLHVGSLLPIMCLVHLQRAGHKPIALVGGATGMIGDPSGKSKERNLLTHEKLEYNVQGIRNQLSRFLDFDCKTNPASLVNNADWIGPMSFIDFMRDVGKHFSVANMMAKESVKRRISDEGISFTEFSYMILQAYDFYHLNKHHGCTLQMGGSDQWGNITAGVDLVRRMGGKGANGLVFPLVTNASGTKFGKTEAGAVWLDPNLTSPYRFYQFWLNSADSDALKYLKFFTTLNPEDVAELAALQQAAPHKRDIQKRLAKEVTLRVHGHDALDGVTRASQAMFGGDLNELSPGEIGDVFEEVPSTEMPRSEFQGDGSPILNLFTQCGLTKSNGEARNLSKGGGLNVNNHPVSDPKYFVKMEDSIGGKFIVLRKGKKKYHLIKIIA